MFDSSGSSYCRHDSTTVCIVPIQLRYSFAQPPHFYQTVAVVRHKIELPTSFHVRRLMIARCDRALSSQIPHVFFGEKSPCVRLKFDYFSHIYNFS